MSFSTVTQLANKLTGVFGVFLSMVILSSLRPPGTLIVRPPPGRPPPAPPPARYLSFQGSLIPRFLFHQSDTSSACCMTAARKAPFPFFSGAGKLGNFLDMFIVQAIPWAIILIEIMIV